MLRRQKVVTLDTLPTIEGGQQESLGVLVREITPLLAPLLHKAVLGAIGSSEESENGPKTLSMRDVADMLLGDPELKLQLLEACCDLGEEVRNIGGYTFLQLWEGFEEVNAPFLERLVASLNLPPTQEEDAATQQSAAAS